MTKNSTIKSVIAGVLAFSLIAGAVPSVLDTTVPVSAAPALESPSPSEDETVISGNWERNDTNYPGSGTWSFDTVSGALTIEGTGWLTDYFGKNVVCKNTGIINSNIKSVKFGNSITGTGIGAFSGFQKITSLELNEGLKFISTGAFRACVGIKTLTIPRTVKKIADTALSQSDPKGTIIINHSKVVLTEGMFTYKGTSFCDRVIKVEQDNLSEEAYQSYLTIFPNAQIVTQRSLDLVNIGLNYLHFDYTGDAITPEIFFDDNGRAIENPEDYFTIEGDLSATDPGSYTITVTPIEGGMYLGDAKTIIWYIDEPVATSFSYKVTGGTAAGTTSGTFEDGTRVTVTADQALEGFGWYDVTDPNNETLVSEYPTYTFFIHTDTYLEYKQLNADDAEVQGAANVYFGSAIGSINDQYMSIPVYVNWELPEGAVVTKGGTYRLFTNEEPTKDELLETGKFKASSKLVNRRAYTYNLNVSTVGESISQDLYMVVCVEYTLDGESYTVTSDVATNDALVEFELD